MKGCRPLEIDEVELVGDSFGGKYGNRNKALFLLGIRSGFRVSELLSLRVRNVRSGRRILDRVTVDRRHMKRKVESRTVLLHPQAKAALEIWLEELGQQMKIEPDTFVFQSRKSEKNQANKAISRVQAWRILDEAFQANLIAGNLGTHCMRKTFADRMYDRLNKDLVKTQRALGHKNVNSTVSYLSFREEEIDEAILGME